jgi:ATP-dependent Clp protease, protease subunit
MEAMPMKNRLAKLFRDNLQSRGRFEVKAESDTEATIYLYDAIGSWYGIEAKDFVKELAAQAGKKINLRINSPGGDVFDARAIHTALRAHSGVVVAHIDGLAASAATYIAMAADEVRIAEGAFMMIHNAWGLVIGNKEDMLSMAGTLEKIDGSIRSDYIAKTGKKPDEIRAMMDAETWMTAQEALDNGFVDSIFTGEKAENSFNLDAYDKAPEGLRVKAHPPADEYNRAVIERRLNLVERLGR